MKGVTDQKGMPAGPGPEGYRFEHKLIINASANVIWSVLSKVNEWDKWSILYPQASGNLVQGSILKLIIHVPGTKNVDATALVEKVEEEKLLIFKSITQLPEALMNGVRYFEIRKIDEDSCIVTDGEVVGGLLGVASAHVVTKGLFKGLQSMNEGLKEQAEKYMQAGENLNDTQKEKPI
jgi:hypothetical protein